MEVEKAEYLHRFVEEMDWYNRIMLDALLPSGAAWRRLPRPLQSWLRNYIAASIIYFVSSFLWCFYAYHWKRKAYVLKDSIPSKKTMLLQIIVSMKALPWYSTLPTLSEYVIEKGWTKCFFSISEVGWPSYVTYVALYLLLLEFGIYWMHRELHDIKPLYKYLHASHHAYNQKNILSPFAGMALQPLDGLLQAAPHVMALFIVPIHLTTHLVLMFCEGVWVANIHDCIHGKIWPVMGAGYHTIHHTAHRHNYGHYTIWMDWMLGTLRHPQEEEEEEEDLNKAE